MAKKYIIYAPKLSGSNGIRALYTLHDLLWEKGYEAYMFCPDEHCGNYHYINSIDKKMRSYDIIVYPEIIIGNPLQFRNVVRWVLYFPGKNGGATSYHHSEMIFTWDTCYYNAPEIYLSGIDRNLFFDEHLPKTQDCYFVHKGGKWKYVKEIEGFLEINMDYPATRKELAQILKTTRILYSYDAYSAINLEARLCGAQVKIITENGFKDYWEEDRFDKDILEHQLEYFIKITQVRNYKGDIESYGVCKYLKFAKRFVMLYIYFILEKIFKKEIFYSKKEKYQRYLQEHGIITLNDK